MRRVRRPTLRSTRAQVRHGLHARPRRCVVWRLSSLQTPCPGGSLRAGDGAVERRPARPATSKRLWVRTSIACWGRRGDHRSATWRASATRGSARARDHQLLRIDELLEQHRSGCLQSWRRCHRKRVGTSSRGVLNVSWVRSGGLMATSASSSLQPPCSFRCACSKGSNRAAEGAEQARV